MISKFSFVLLLAFGLLLCDSKQCIEGTAREDESCKNQIDNGGDALNEVTDDVALEMRVELLQRDLQLSDRRNLEKTNSVHIHKIVCPFPMALQTTTKDDNSEIHFQWLNLSTGVYIDNMSLNLTLIAPDKIRSVNACAVNPKDDHVYCAMQVYGRGGFLVRTDGFNVGYITKLLGFRYSATFDDDDNFYISGHNKLTILNNVSTYAALPTYHGLNGDGETSVKLKIGGTEETNYELGADFAIVYADWEGHGKTKYLVSVKNTDLMVVSLSSSPYKLYTLPNTNLPQVYANVQRVWGAAWKWGKDGSVYFAADDGDGLWELLDNTVSLTSGNASFKKIAEANPTNWNDGFSCGDHFPDDPGVKGLSCEHDLYQSVTVGKVNSAASKSYIRHMSSLDGGSFVVDFEVKPYYHANEMLNINACAINPKNDKLYCAVQMSQGPRIAAIDNTTVGFVQQAPASYCFAAIFGTAAKDDYWIYCTDGLFTIYGLSVKSEYRDYKLAAVANDKDWKKHPGFGIKDPPFAPRGAIGADLVTWEDGGKVYLISIVESKENNVSIVNITDGNPKLVNPGAPNYFFKSVGLPEPMPGNDTNTWGSAWKTPKNSTSSDKVLFSRDKGAKVYELDALDMAAYKATFKFHGDMDDAAWHDGFTCREKIVGIAE